jgi:hypothetical protein
MLLKGCSQANQRHHHHAYSDSHQVARNSSVSAGKASICETTINTLAVTANAATKIQFTDNLINLIETDLI